jgi:plastocyanin
MKKLQNHSPQSQHKEERSQGPREHHMGHEHLSPASAAAKQPLVININLQFDPAVSFAGKPTRMVLIVAEQRSGEPIPSFEKIHDKLMHLIIVNLSDLSSFAHLHPIFNKENGSRFEITHTFQEADEYKAWVDVKPHDASQVLAAFRFKVFGEPVHKSKAVGRDEEQFSKVVDNGRYRIDLVLPDHVAAGHNVDFIFRVADSKGNPIHDLEPLMAAGGHCVIISSDAKDFLHVHPAEQVKENWRGGPDVAFSATFPKSGVYRIWGQFHHKGKVITADYDLVVN